MLSRFNKGLLIVMSIVALSAVIYALANTNNFSNTANNIGSGSDAVSGYAVSAVVYSLSTANPLLVSQVAFTLTPVSGSALDNATIVKIRTVSTDTTFATWTCTVVATAVTCTNVGGVAADDIATLDIVARN